MDEVDHIQEAATLAQEAILAERRRLAALDAAITPPTERDCDSCGDSIPPARLKTLPRTRLCVDCATDQERLRR
jgi:phage/conjugal plasmid C-4 type zinc finger TraR family protein